MKTGFSFGSGTTYLHAVQQQPGLLKAWELLTGEDWPEELTRRRNEIRLELAWRLMDSSKMLMALKGLQGQHHLDIREAVHGFFLSAHTGQWQQMEALGKALTSASGSLDGFHRAALDDLSIPDYESILQIVQLQKSQLPASWTLVDHQWRITNLQVKLIRTEYFDSRFKGVSAQMKADYLKMAGKDGWIKRENPPTDLLQVGAVAHWSEGFGQPPVSGFIWKDRILMRGFVSYDAPGDSGMQLQTFDMHPSQEAPNHWMGINITEAQIPDGKGGLKPGLQSEWGYAWDMILDDNQ